jgi:hypothetical protein
MTLKRRRKSALLGRLAAATAGPKDHIWAAYRKRRQTILSTLLHAVTVLVFLSVLWALRRYIPATIPLNDLESAIQLLSQILAMVVGVLLIGTTVSMQSYDDSDTLNAIQSDMDKAAEPLFDHFFRGGWAAHKLDRSSFRTASIARADIETFRFYDESAEPKDSWFVYRPLNDGAWYQVAYSPFAKTALTRCVFNQIGVVHEVAICAHLVILAVSEFRSSGCALVSKTRGTNGSRWFIEDFEKYVAAYGVKLPPGADLAQIQSMVHLAVQSEHYMREEFREHAMNLTWEPYVLSRFQFAFNEYVTSVAHLLGKLQKLRLVNSDRRYPGISARFSAKTIERLFLEPIHRIKVEMDSLRARIVSAHGAASYFHGIKRMSVLGIGLALGVLLALLIAWPFMKSTATPEVRLLGFSVIYAAGLSALLESSWFLGRLLWQRHGLG